MNSIKDPELCKYMLNKVGHMIQAEIAKLCTEKFALGLLEARNKDDLVSFDWRKLTSVLEKHLPLLYHILLSATKTKTNRPNRDAVIGMCVAMICKLRRPKMSVVQKILSLVLYAGHSAKQVCFITLSF